MSMLEIVIEALLITIALSLDAFLSGLSYGTSKIKVSIFIAFIVGFICTLILSVSLFLSRLIALFIPPQVTLIICVIIFCILGFIKIFDSYIKKIIRKNKNINKNVQMHLFNLKIIINVYADYEEADFDKSKQLSVKEAVLLAIALSLDGFCAGIGAGLVISDISNILILIAFSLIASSLFLMLGQLLGRLIAKKVTVNLEWLSGLMFIIIAIFKIV